MKRFLKILSIVLITFLVLGSVIIFKTEWILTPRLMNLMVRKFASSYHPTWADLRVQLSTTRWNQKELSIQASNLCVDSSNLKGCLKKLDADLFWSWPFPIRPIAFRKLVLISDEIKVTSTQSSQKKSSGPKGSSISIPSLNWVELIAPFNWDELLVSIEKLTLKEKEFSIHISRENSSIPAIVGTLKGADGVDANLRWSRDDLQRSTFDFNAEVKSQKYFLHVSPGDQSKIYQVSVGGDLRDHDLNFEAPLTLYTENNQIHLSGNLHAKWNNSILNTKVPELIFYSDKATSELTDVTLSAAASLHSNLRWSKFLHLDIHGKYHFSDSRLQIQIKNLNPKLDSDISFDCALITPMECHTPPQAKITLPYSLLVDLLKGSPYEIFAPFQVLKGTIEVDTTVSPSFEDIQMQAKTHLVSKNQKIDLVASGSLAHPLAARSLSLDIVLNDIEIQLPNLDSKQMPIFSMDSRIQTTTRTPKTSAKELPFQIHIRTENPIQLRSNLARGPIPILLNYEISNQTHSGSLNIKPFDVRIFRRNARVQKLTLESTPPSNIEEIDGLIEYTTSEAKIEIHLTGNASKPNVHFTSSPPLDQRQIISLLLFGRSSFGTLGADEATTVGNAEVALASGAFGLASLYLFASTPIEFVGYDPVSHAYSVRVRLPGGISAEYGTNFNSQDRQYLTFRKRLGRHWMLSTEWQTPTLTEEQSLSTFLEWFMRF